jgi:hypothetical protein
LPDLGISRCERVFDCAAPNSTELDFNTGPPRRFEVAKFDTSGKPKLFSSADERDVKPCF